MKKMIAVVLSMVSMASPLFAQRSCEPPDKSKELQSTMAAWADLKAGSCSSVPSRRLSEVRVAELLNDVLSEKLTLSGAEELFETSRRFRCDLSNPARIAFDALVKEAEIRRFDFASFTKGEIDLVVEATMPDEWQALLDETEHLAGSEIPEKSPHVIVIGCVVAFAGGIGLVAACLNDVDAEFQRCDSGAYCNGPVSWSCCAALRTDDRVNCYISFGQNGPDQDYPTCCH